MCTNCCIGAADYLATFTVAGFASAVLVGGCLLRNVLAGKANSVDVEVVRLR
jgi:hypothetical protein